MDCAFRFRDALCVFASIDLRVVNLRSRAVLRFVAPPLT